MTDFFQDITPLAYQPDSADLAFRHYNPDEMFAGKRMEDHLRFAVAYWRSFAWPGGDPFGAETFERPWFGDTMDLAKLKADVAFEMFDLLNVPFFCWHDADIRPEGDTFAQSLRNFQEIIDYFGEKMESSKTKLLWGTANLFSHRRFMSGAATNPDPEIFAWSAATVKNCMDADITGLTLDVPSSGAQGAALGAARLAQLASGDGAPKDVLMTAQTEHSFHANPALKSAYAENLQRYRDAWHAAL